MKPIELAKTLYPINRSLTWRGGGDTTVVGVVGVAVVVLAPLFPVAAAAAVVVMTSMVWLVMGAQAKPAGV